VETSARYKIGAFSALVVQAGTATSVRGRGEANSFNRLRIASGAVTIERYAWTGTDFTIAASEAFLRSPLGWRRQEP
jgi:hypothetical protein